MESLKFFIEAKSNKIWCKAPKADSRSFINSAQDDEKAAPM